MLKQIVEAYLKIFPGDRSKLNLLSNQITAGGDLGSRTNYTGHVTGSALIFSPDKQKLLLIYHPTFDAWQQPGGHWEEHEAGPWLAAEREAKEETGFKLAKSLPLADNRIPIQIDSHLVPTKPPKNEPAHYHHDFRYAFLAASESLNLTDAVIKQARWRPIKSLDDARLIEAVERCQRLLLKA